MTAGRRVALRHDLKYFKLNKTIRTYSYVKKLVLLELERCGIKKNVLYVINGLIQTATERDFYP